MATEQASETAEGAVSCDHDDFQGEMKFARLRDDAGDPSGYSVDITAHCGKCGAPIYWIGLPAGYSPTQPMVSVDGKEMRAPFVMVAGAMQFGSAPAVMQKIDVSIVRAKKD